ncbi:hypothetical protein ES703_16201 [subsurface metagenome]
MKQPMRSALFLRISAARQLCSPLLGPQNYLPASKSLSLLPIFRSETLQPHETLYFHFGTNRALRQGPWKLVSAKLGRWELYNLDEDRTELNDLSEQKPERVAAMEMEWFRMAEHIDRLKGLALAAVGDSVKSLSFRKDTSSGSASKENRNKKK